MSASGSTSRSRRLDRYVLWAVVVVGAMSIVASIGFRSTLSDWGFAGAAVVGAVGACAIVLLARWRRLLLGESVALSALGFVLLGGVAVGGLPAPAAYATFVRGLVDGWADLLSAAPPADVTDELRALPFTVAWLAASIGGEIARHTRRPGLPAIGPLLALVLSLLFLVEERWLAMVQGGGTLAGALVLIGLAQRLGVRRAAVASVDEFDAGAVPKNRARLGLGALVVIGAVAAAPYVGPRLPLAEARERFDLRQYQVPPFDPLALPSPLSQVKASLKENRREDIVFVVSGETPVARWPVAVMSDYDGVVWTVADPQRNREVAEFVPVDTQLPELERVVPEGSETTEHSVEIRDLGGYFLPVPGIARALSFPTDPDQRMNLVTGSVAVPGGLRDGFTYDVTSAVAPEITENELAAADITPVDRRAELRLLPPPVTNLAADLVQGQAQGWPQMAAIRDAFVAAGFYDVTDVTPPGHSYGRIGQMLEDPERIVGYEEQYAAAAAIMARTAQLPARVVVGYVIPDDRWSAGRAEVQAKDISAWVELDAGPLGWIAVDVTPPRDQVPDPQSEGSTTQEVAIPNPPPPPPPPPEVQPPRQEDEDVDKEDEFEAVRRELDAGPSYVAWVALGAGGGSLLLLAMFAAVVIGWKAMRRWRRRNAASSVGQVAGAWAEAVDRAVEAGAPLLVRTTPHEAVRGYVIERPELVDLEGELRQLADHVDRAAYAATAPADHDVDSAWSASDRVGHGLRARRGVPGRLRMRLDPRPLRRDQVKAGARQ